MMYVHNPGGFKDGLYCVSSVNEGSLLMISLIALLAHYDYI